MKTIVYEVGVWVLVVFLLSFSMGEEKKKIKKDPRDYTDADLERLYDQWEEADEPLEEDELPEWKRKAKSPGISLDQLNMGDPEQLLQATKKGKTLMVFIDISGEPTKEESEQITTLWQQSLKNNHIEVTRYLISDKRAIFVFADGGLAWEAKNFLTQQDRCKEVEIEGKTYPGKGAAEEREPPNKKKEL